MRITVFFFLSLLMGGPPAVAQAPVVEVDQIRFHSSFWPNLHHTLYAAAQASLPPEVAAEIRLPRIRGTRTEPLGGDLEPEEREAWDRAVAFYRESLARRDLRTGDRMTPIHWTLVESGETLARSDAIGDDHRRHLLAAAPVYRRHWWPGHDRAIRAWIDDVADKIQTVGSRVRPRLTALLEVDWFAEPVRVEITYYGRAYTTIRPRTLTTLAMLDSNYAGWAGAEMVFHEVSHALTEPIEARIEREATAAGKPAGGLWHVVMFYLVGEVWRSELALRGVEYSPYMYATGLFDRAWGDLRGPVEIHLGPYLTGASDAGTAFRQLISSLP